MAKRKKEIPEGQRRREMKLPAGVKAAPRAAGDFWNPDPGDELIGTIGGMVTIKGKKNKSDQERYTLLTENARLWVLPNHYDLHQQLEGIASEHGGSIVGVKVYIGFEGFEEANVQGGKLARYSVGVYEQD